MTQVVTHGIRLNRRHRRLRDLGGQRFGRLIVGREVGRRVSPNGRAQRMFECRCDCGAVTVVSYVDLRYGHTRSCGCLVGLGLDRGPGGGRRRAAISARRRLERPVLFEFRGRFLALLGERGLTLEVLRMRWGGKASRWNELFLRFYAVPSLTEEAEVAAMMNLRGSEAERWRAMVAALREGVGALRRPGRVVL